MNTNRVPGTERLDEFFQQIRSGDMGAFANWMRLVEIPLRRSLRPFARTVDVEAVIQETLLRMWLVARDPDRVLVGEYASLKYAFRMAQFIAMEERRRSHPDRFVDLRGLDDDPRFCCEPEMPDPALARAIWECLNALPGKPRRALEARLNGTSLPDKVIAAGLRMKPNTFLQNVVRARKGLKECLGHRGVRLGEVHA